jgi:hypothetical protein
MKRLLIAALMLAGTVAMLDPASAQVVDHGSTPPPPIVPLHPSQGPIVRSPQVSMPLQSSGARLGHMRRHRAGARAHF